MVKRDWPLPNGDGNRVAIQQCRTYHPQTVYESIQSTVKALGGLSTFISPGQRVFIKPNLLMGKHPEEAVTTHPSVVAAVARLVNEIGAHPVIGDSPGGPFNPTLLKSLYRKTGMMDAARETGAELNYDTSEVEVDNPSGKILKSFTVCQAMVKADAIIALPKLKTHGMMTYTGAVKLMFGAVPGMKKIEYHYRLPDVASFAEALIDIILWARPALQIMDGVVGMEGAGPSGGTPREVGIIAASANPFSLDAVCCHLAGIPLQRVPTVAEAIDRGLPGASLQQVKLGQPVDRFILGRPFELPPSAAGVDFSSHLPGFLGAWLKKALRPRPEFVPKTCTGCSHCVEHCPSKALTIAKGQVPTVDLDTCIRCFCCQELCPQQAVTIRRSPLARLIFAAGSGRPNRSRHS